MSVRFNNNTSFDDEMAIEEVKHWCLLIDKDKLESVEINDKTVNFYGHEDTFLGEFVLDKDKVVSGKIRWFNEFTGEGVIRLLNGTSLHFYSCNVEGADSMNPEFVSNIHFEEGDLVKATFSSDSFTLKALGLVNIQKI